MVIQKVILHLYYKQLKTIINTMEKATATSPITKEVNGVKMRLTRRFLGNLNHSTPMETKELKAYIKGNEQFAHGRTYIKGFGFIPTMHDVRQEYFYTK